jgi:hypothetical protein
MINWNQLNREVPSFLGAAALIINFRASYSRSYNSFKCNPCRQEITGHSGADCYLHISVFWNKVRRRGAVRFDSAVTFSGVEAKKSREIISEKTSIGSCRRF